jgi:xanthine dehydrogenase accessory factor
MRDVIADIDRWLAEGEAVAIATVVETWGSAPRGVGSRMAVSAHGKIAGSVSGGCVEGAVVEAAQTALRSGAPRLLHFGVADADAWAVGLACGGSIDVFVAALDVPLYEAKRAALLAERPLATVTVVAGSEDLLGRKLLVMTPREIVGSLGGILDGPAIDAALAALAAGASRRFSIPPVEVLIEVSLPSPTLVIVGGVHIAIALVSLAKALGWRTIVVDPRKAFGSELRFPHADKLLHAWPDDALGELGLTPSTAVALLTHDPKLDDPALRIALPSPAFYVGALGSKKTQEKRRARLLSEGLTAGQLDRLHAPIGLDLGGRSPEEIALAVMAEIVAARNGRTPTR